MNNLFLHQIGEFKLIDYIRKRIEAKNKDVITSIGDDAAVIKKDKHTYYLLTTDTLIEDVHFKLDYFSPFDIGYKAVAVSISDIAAMGGIPKYMLVTIGIDKNKPLKFVTELYKGMKMLTTKYYVDIVGGDTIYSKKLIITTFILGEVNKHYLKKRSGAQPNDLICVTGTLGNSATALEFLKKGKYNELTKYHLRPVIRLKEAQLLIKKFNITAMIDISDGLISDLFKIAKESKVGFHIFKQGIPISNSCKKLATQLNKEPLFFALYGGEDYELLFTCSNGKKIVINNTPVRVIGKIIKDKSYTMEDSDTNRIEYLKEKGYNHFIS